jgi:orotidine-5'-phosphate decarboxylase
LGIHDRAQDQTLRLAALALANGCQGIVSSAREAATLRRELKEDFVIVTPGVRPAGTAHGDQARVVTPSEAIAAGATYIVVGRPITAAPDPAAEARAILAEISSESLPIAAGH